MNLDKMPKELTDRRDMIECNFILSLYKDTSLLSDYNNVENGIDILTSDGMFYYGILTNMVKSGFQKIDNASIYDYLSDKKELKKGFESRGGWKTVQEMMSIYSTENTPIYYDELSKNNLLCRLYEKGFSVIDNLEKFKNMTCEQVYDFYEYQLANISIGKIEKMESYDLSDYDGYMEWIKKVDQGLMVGYKVNSPILNYMMAGIHPSNIALHIAGIGQGKTTTAILLYVLGAIKSGENVVIMSNEQGVDEFRNMLIPCVMFNELRLYVKGMNRQKFITGHLNEEQHDAVRKAIKWITEQTGKIQFVPLVNYDLVNIRKVIKKYSNIGYGLFLVDTIKPLDEADSAAWAQFSEVAKALFLTAKQTNTAIVCTAQATGESLGKKHMDLSCIAKSKAIAETAAQCISFRSITSDEIDKVKPWQYKKNTDGTNSKIKVTYDLDPNEHYICLFLLKNRFGATDPQLILKFNQSFCTLEEIGYWNCPYDGWRK